MNLMIVKGAQFSALRNISQRFPRRDRGTQLEKVLLIQPTGHRRIYDPVGGGESVDRLPFRQLSGSSGLNRIE